MVYDGIEADKNGNWYPDKNSSWLRNVTLVVRKQPGTNVVQVVDDVKALIPTFREQLPPSVLLDVRSDRSVAIRDSVEDVKFTLILSLVLVVLVIFIFLRNFSA